MVVKDGKESREREEMSQDNYLKRKKCTAYKLFGIPQAQANIRAGKIVIKACHKLN